MESCNRTHLAENVPEMFNEFDGEVSPPNGLTPNYVSAFDVRSRMSIEDKNKFRGHLKEVRQPLWASIEYNKSISFSLYGWSVMGIPHRRQDLLHSHCVVRRWKEEKSDVQETYLACQGSSVL